MDSLANEFSLHSNVVFGMSMEEVIAIEDARGFNYSIDEITDTGYYEPQSKCVRVYGQIAGFDESFIDFMFLPSNKLYSAIYSLGHKNELGAYTPVRTSLINKYGNPVDYDKEPWCKTINEDKEWHEKLKLGAYAVPDAMEEYINSSQVPEWIDATMEYAHQDFWEIPGRDNKSIIIFGIEYVIKEQNMKTLRQLHNPYSEIIIGYQSIKTAKLEEAKKMFAQAMNLRNHQLLNDL